MANTGAIPEFSHIWFDDDEISAYDGGLGISVKFPTGLSIGVPGDALLGLCKTGSGNVELVAEENALKVQSGRSRASLATKPFEYRIWPYPEDAGKTIDLELTEEFLDGLRRALVVKAKDATRVEHHGVTLFPVSKGIKLYSTDSRTIVQVTVPVEVPRGTTRVVFPRAFAEQVVSQCGTGSKIRVAPDHLRAEGDGVTLYTNLLDAEGMVDLPKIVADFVSAKGVAVATIPPGFTEALDRAVILAKGEDPVVDLRIDGGSLTIYGSYSLGILDEELELDAQLPKGSIQLLGVQLKKALSEADRFAVLDRAAVFFGGEDFVFLVAKKS